MNRVFLLGRLTKDPDIRYTNSGKVVASITLAVDRPFSGADGQRETDFIQVVIWGKSAENLGNTVHKGHRLLVEGRLQIRSYDAQDGGKRWVSEVIADRFEYVERKQDSGDASQMAVSTGQQQPPAATQTGGSPMQAFGTPVPFDEEIPF